MIVAEWYLLPAIDVAKFTRHEAAEAARPVIAASLGLDPEANDAADDAVKDARGDFNRTAGTADRLLETRLYPRDELL